MTIFAIIHMHLSNYHQCLYYLTLFLFVETTYTYVILFDVTSRHVILRYIIYVMLCDFVSRITFKTLYKYHL